MHEDPLVGFGRLPPPFRWAGSPGFSSDYKALAFINGKALAQLLNLGFDRCNGLFVIQVAEDVANPTRQLTAFGFLEATGGYRRRTDPQTGSDERRTRIVRHAVLVHRDVGPAQSGIRIFTGNVLLDQGQQEQVVLSTAGYHIEAALDEYFRHGLGVLQDLLLVFLEFRLQRFLEADRLSRNHMLQRAALGAGEHGRVEFLFDLFVGTGEDHAATGTTQGLVGRGSDHVRNGNRVGTDAGRHQTRHLGHIHKQVGTYFVDNSPEAGKVQSPAAGRPAGHEHLRLVPHREALYFVIVDQALVVDAILHGIVELAGRADLGAVGQMTAMGQAHAQDGVTCIE